MGEVGDEEARELTMDAFKAGHRPADLWAMPVHHIAFVFYKPPVNVADDQDKSITVAQMNERATVPFIPPWITLRKPIEFEPDPFEEFDHAG